MWWISYLESNIWNGSICITGSWRSQVFQMPCWPKYIPSFIILRLTVRGIIYMEVTVCFGGKFISTEKRMYKLQQTAPEVYLWFISITPFVWVVETSYDRKDLRCTCNLNCWKCCIQAVNECVYMTLEHINILGLFLSVNYGVICRDICN